MHARAFNHLIQRLRERLDSRPDSHHANRILSHLQKLEGAASALDKVKANRNPMDTESAHKRKVAKAAEKLRDAAARIDAAINDEVVRGTAEISTLIDKAAGLVPGDYDQEIRSALRAMDPQQRHKILQDALEAGDSQTIAATCLCPALLSGVDAEQQRWTLETLRHRKAGDLMGTLEDLGEAFKTAQSATELTRMTFDENYRADEQANIDKAEAAAVEAETALNAIAD
jgi:hypothetical protein